jgi:hypothetical protein
VFCKLNYTGYFYFVQDKIRLFRCEVKDERLFQKSKYRHSERSEESHIFSFQVKKSKKRSFGLRPQDDGQGKLIKILGHSP